MSDTWVGILVLIFAGWVVVKFVARRLKDRALTLRKEQLITRFGPETAQLIMDQQIFRGMTKEMLEESWGQPDDLDEELIRSKKKQTWKYNQVGTNRYKNRVYLENGVVVGWKTT